jgi:hypothetical protein
VTAAVTEKSVSREPERWRDKHGIAEHFSCGIRWIEARMVEGMPHTYIAVGPSSGSRKLNRGLMAAAS